ncbi:MAG: hypothetical protein IT393_04555 [Nitrospirae bacterium]|nr:hypothetical protein [Nitrospirota bacterium]
MRTLVILFVFVLLNSVYAGAASGKWIKMAGEIERTLEDAMRDYKDGKVNEAVEKVADAYFGIFEGEEANMEIAVRRYLSLKKVTVLEKGFGDLRKGMSEKRPLPELRKEMNRLIGAIKDTAGELDRKGVGLDVAYQ